ncbi:glycosyltransferase [Algoriphagus sp.]|uniref:glycosyltransferase n=1 Tax=Algoriphagus sp. TaxID=1872435 RepID=UPI003F7149AC
MATIFILNFPNYYCSYFLLGLNRIARLKFSPREEFAHLNNKPFLVIEYQGKVAVIENDDPTGVDTKSYAHADLYFATNKLLVGGDYNLPKVNALYPHYPIDNSWYYLSLFGQKGIINLGPKEILRQWYTLIRRPEFINKPYIPPTGNYVFFSGSIWKKEPRTNRKRVDYIRACQQNPLIQFEGGMVSRMDGDPCGISPEFINKKYPAKEFARKSSRSIIGFNNPAVLDAVSWRLAEYWNYGTFVISFPFKIELPTEPEHGRHIHYIQEGDDFAKVISFIMQNEDYREKISRGGKHYFEQNCLPEIQAKRIVAMLGTK